MEECSKYGTKNIYTNDYRVQLSVFHFSLITRNLWDIFLILQYTHPIRKGKQEQGFMVNSAIWDYNITKGSSSYFITIMGREMHNNFIIKMHLGECEQRNYTEFKKLEGW